MAIRFENQLAKVIGVCVGHVSYQTWLKLKTPLGVKTRWMFMV